MICSEWELTPLADVVEIIGGGTPKTRVKEYWGGKIPWLSVKDFNSDNRYVNYSEKYITELGLQNSSTRLLSKGDIIISARGTVGEIAQLGREMAFNQSCYGLRGKPDKLSNDFLYYLLKYQIKNLQNNTHGSVFDTITRDTFNTIKVGIPSLSEQNAIAATLSCLDDIIELNNRINKTLEEMAQAIFKSWFVDFEPFQDGEFEDSELGPIPNGWRVVEFGQVVEEVKERVDNLELPVLSAIKTGNLVLSEDYFDKKVFSKNISKYIVVKPSEFAYNPARINIGSIGMNEFCFSGCVSPVYVVFKSHSRYRLFVKSILKTERFCLEVNKRATGSVRQTLNFKDFARIKIIYPDINVIDRFNLLYEGIYSVQRSAINENSILASIRDTLLPKLMSGEIRVPFEEV